VRVRAPSVSECESHDLSFHHDHKDDAKLK
jgi:hypothetical protein